MNHADANARLLELAYGELSPRDAREVEAHAAGCPSCREELAAIRETRALMALLPPEPPPERGEAIVMAAARQAAEARRPRPLLPPWLWAGAAGAMAAVFVAVVSWQLLRTPPSGPMADRRSDLVARAPAAGAAAPAPAAEPSEKLKGRAATERDARKDEEAPRALSVPEAPPAKRAAKRELSPPAAAGAKSDLAKERASGSLAEGYGAGPEDRGAPLAVGGAGSSAMGRGAAPAAPPATVWNTPPERPAAARPERPRVPAASEEAERAPAAASAPPPAPAAAQKARSMAGAERKSAAPMAARDELAPGAVETRSFAGCPGERRRVVERDEEGRVVRYVREGERGVVEHRYGADGRLVAAFAVEGGIRRALPLDAPGLVRLARDAGIDAPPRCALP